MTTSKSPDTTRHLPRKPAAILQDPSSPLRSVVQHANRLLAIQAIVGQYVPPGVQVASVQDETLHVITSSSAAATQIRYRQRNIIAAIRQKTSDLQISAIKVSVRPIPDKPVVETRQPLPLSDDNAVNIAATAKYIEHEPLRKALMQLASRNGDDT